MSSSYDPPGPNGSPDPSDPTRPHDPRYGADPADAADPGYPHGSSDASTQGEPRWGTPEAGPGQGPGYSYPGTTPYGHPGAPAGPGGHGTPPNSYLVWAILTTVLCCLPLGIVSIVYATQVNSRWVSGDAAGAYEASRKARTWAIWSAVAAVVLWIGYLALFLLFGITTFWFPVQPSGSGGPAV